MAGRGEDARPGASVSEELAAVSGDTELQSEVLEDLEEAVNYREWLCALTAPWLGEDPIEVGSGLGAYAQSWLESGVESLTVTEADPGRLQALRERFTDEERISVRGLSVPITEEGAYSAVVAVNVLEHIEDDVEGLRGMRRLVRSGGNLVVLVPAVPSAMSSFDRAIGHHRRYRRARLRRAAEAAGLEVVECYYLNSVGLLGWYVMVKLLGRRPQAGFVLSTYDRVVVPALRAVEERVRPPVGQSLLLVARTPG